MGVTLSVDLKPQFTFLPANAMELHHQLKERSLFAQIKFWINSMFDFSAKTHNLSVKQMQANQNSVCKFEW